MFREGSITGKIRVAIAGVGNCACALVQGIRYYRNAEETAEIPGITHVRFGAYHINDIEFSAAFDVNNNKVGQKLEKAIFTKPNNTRRFSDVADADVIVQRGPILDSLGQYVKDTIQVSRNDPPVDVAQELEDSKSDLLINYLPVGSERAARWYAEQSLEAGVAFVNCIPVFIASTPEWQKRFADRKLPIAGDDIQSQIGATVLHKTIIRLLIDRGVKVDESYQLNVGGDMDFLNMLEKERLRSKEISKTEAVQAMVPYNVPLKIGPSDYIPFLENQKIMYVWVKGRYFGDTPVYIDCKLSVWDAPNSAGVVIDVIRAIKIALDRGTGGPLNSISSYGFKHPPTHAPAALARQWVDEFIEGKRER